MKKKDTPLNAAVTDPQTKAAWADKLLKLIEKGIPGDWRPACRKGGKTPHPLTNRIAAAFDVMAAA